MNGDEEEEWRGSKCGKDERKEVSGEWKKGGCGGKGEQDNGDERRRHGEKKRSVCQSVNKMRQYLFISSKKQDLLKSSSDPIPPGLHEAPGFNTLHFPAAGGGALC